MKKLIVVGAGPYSREILCWLPALKEFGTEWELGGFLDRNPEILKKYSYDFPIIGSIENYQPQENDIFAMALTTPTIQKIEIANKLLENGANFISLIHPSVIIGNNVTIGRGCILSAFSTFSCDIIIGDYVTFNGFVGVGHDAIIADGCTIQSFVNINGNAKLGKGVEIGSHGGVLPKVKVGDFAKIGAGSIAYKDVKPNTTVIGVPAKKLF